eukprot:Nk52_evm1s856 gene=Nk52_evmTU1s856
MKASTVPVLVLALFCLLATAHADMGMNIPQSQLVQKSTARLGDATEELRSLLHSSVRSNFANVIIPEASSEDTEGLAMVSLPAESEESTALEVKERRGLSLWQKLKSFSVAEWFSMLMSTRVAVGFLMHGADYNWFNQGWTWKQDGPSGPECGIKEGNCFQKVGASAFFGLVKMWDTFKIYMAKIMDKEETFAGCKFNLMGLIFLLPPLMGLIRLVNPTWTSFIMATLAIDSPSVVFALMGNVAWIYLAVRSGYTGFKDLAWPIGLLLPYLARLLKWWNGIVFGFDLFSYIYYGLMGGYFQLFYMLRYFCNRQYERLKNYHIQATIDSVRGYISTGMMVLGKIAGKVKFLQPLVNFWDKWWNKFLRFGEYGSESAVWTSGLSFVFDAIYVESDKKVKFLANDYPEIGTLSSWVEELATRPQEPLKGAITWPYNPGKIMKSD